MKIQIKINDNETVELSKKHDDFCLQLIQQNNATEAYIIVYQCKRSTAKREGFRLLQREDIKKVVQYYREQFTDAIMTAKHEVIASLYHDFTIDPLDMFEEGSTEHTRLSKIPLALRQSLKIKPSILPECDIEYSNKTQQEARSKMLEIHGIAKEQQQSQQHEMQFAGNVLEDDFYNEDE